MDPFELLKKDHEKVSDLFKRIESASGKAKLRIFQQIKSELELHTYIEETIFYPVLEKARETKDLTLEAYEEHKVVKSLLGELDNAKGVSDEWKAKLTVLRENIEHHVDEEENELFDKANDVLTGEEAESLGDRMQAEKVKRGGSAPATNATTEKPGLLRKIANALGVGPSSQKASKASSKKESKKKAAKKGAKVAVKAPEQESKSARVTAGKKRTVASKSKAARGTKSRAASSRKGAARKSRTGKRPARRAR